MPLSFHFPFKTHKWRSAIITLRTLHNKIPSLSVTNKKHITTDDTSSTRSYYTYLICSGMRNELTIHSKLKINTKQWFWPRRYSHVVSKLFLVSRIVCDGGETQIDFWEIALVTHWINLCEHFLRWIEFGALFFNMPSRRRTNDIWNFRVLRKPSGNFSPGKDIVRNCRDSPLGWVRNQRQP